MELPKIIIAPNKERAIQRLHPWIFSGAIQKIEGNPSEGDLVKVYGTTGKFLAIGFYGTGSIAVRILSFEDISIDREFWTTRLQDAFNLRKSLGLIGNVGTNIYRLVHAEGDLLPGLIIDVYNKVAVFQSHHPGTYNFRHIISEILLEVTEGEILAVFDKSLETLPNGISNGNEYLTDKPIEIGIPIENGISFKIDWETGQKTGFFIDQRENRLLLSKFCKDKKVLNTFCYTGGFSVYALKAGASAVHSVDSSQLAIEMCIENVSLLNLPTSNHIAVKADAVQYIKDLDQEFDVIILDPPAFAKHTRARHNAIQAYKRINLNAMRQIKAGGIIFTFSCSQVVDKELFNSTIHAAAIECGRSVRVLHQLHQPADHPINVFHPESEYLKGLVLKID